VDDILSFMDAVIVNDHIETLIPGSGVGTTQGSQQLDKRFCCKNLCDYNM
jgi:hypothetical protein